MDYSAFYKRGLAVGQSNIYKDIMEFRFKDEVFVFPTFAVWDVTRWNGKVFEADVKALRKIQKKAHAGA